VAAAPETWGCGWGAASQVQCRGKARVEGLGLGAGTMAGCGGSRLGADGCFWKWEWKE